jgi:proline dehydrogenase
MSSTIGYWNGDNDTPQLVARTYLTSMDAIVREGLDCYLSIKAPALQFDQGLVTEIVARSRDSGIGIHFDSLGPQAADRTFELIARSAQDYSQIGCTLPGRWRRSVSDVERVVALGLNVRVVKGQWIDPECPGMDQRQGYLAVVKRLAGQVRHVAVATHDPLLAREALNILRDSGTPCVLELLLGLPLKAAMQVAHEAGVAVRLYIPYGHSWLPYALSQIRKNPRIIWWMARDTIFGRLS